MSLPSFYKPITELVGEDEPSNSAPSLDHNADELPFTSLGGRRFEILSYLLEIDAADDDDAVTLVQSSGDKGRDLLVHRHGALVRVIQCKNQLNKVARPDLVKELVKLLLFDEVESFLPATAVLYELWAPRGFSGPADRLIAEWPDQLDDAEVQSAFQSVTSTFTSLGHFRWENIQTKLLGSLKSQFRLKREDGITLSRRTRDNIAVYQQFFRAIVVMQQADVDTYLDSKLAPRVAQLVRMTADEERADSASAIDHELDEAASCINNHRCEIAESLLQRLEEERGPNLNRRQRYRLKANLGAAAYRMQQFKKAARFFLEAAALEPENEVASTNEVLAHFLLEDDRMAFELASRQRLQYANSGRLLAIWIATAPPDMTVDEIEQAVNPDLLLNDPEVSAAFGEKLLLAGRVEAAREYALRSQQLAPIWAQAFLFGARSSIVFTLQPPAIQQEVSVDRQKIIDEGIIAAGRARELGISQSDVQMQAQALAARSELYLFAGDIEAASADARLACRLASNDVGNLVVLAQTQLVQGKIEVAIVTLEQALEIQNRPDVCLMLSRALRVRNGPGDRERSVDLIKDQNLTALPEMMRAPMAINVVQLLGAQGAWSRASEYLQSSGGALDAVTRQTLNAHILSGDGHSREAGDNANEALQNLGASTHSHTREFLARVLMKMGRLSDALPLYQELFSYNLPSFDPMQLIECAGRLSRDEVVLDTFDELHRRTAVDWRLIQIEASYLERYHPEKAIDRLSAFLDRHADHRMARLARSFIAWQLGRADLVAARLDELPSVSEVPVEYIRRVLKVLSLGEDFDRAIDYAYRFLKLHFDQVEAHRSLIFSALFLRRSQSLEGDPNLPNVLEGAAVCYRELPDGPVRWTVLERTDSPDSNFEERSIDDPISQALLGKAVGDTFVLVPGMMDRMGRILQILPKYVHRFQDSLNELPVRFPAEAANFQSVRLGRPEDLESGIALMLANVRERAEQIKLLQSLYVGGSISVHFYAKQCARNAYEAVLHLAETEQIPVKCSGIDPIAFAAAVEVLETSKFIILDLSAIATIRLLGLEDLLTLHRGKVVLSADAVKELRDTLVDEMPYRRAGTIVYDEGRYRMYEETPLARANRIKQDKEFFETVLAAGQIKPHLGLASMDHDQSHALIQFFGQYGAEAMVLAMEPDTVLWTDDQIHGDAASVMLGVRRTWSQAFLEYCRRKGLIDGERYATAVAIMVGMRYQNTRFDGSVLAQAARLAEFRPSAAPFAQMAEIFSAPNASVEQQLRAILFFFTEISLDRIVAQGSNGMLAALLEALWQNPHARMHMLALRRASAKVFGLNVVTEARFNAVFDDWYRAHDMLAMTQN